MAASTTDKMMKTGASTVTTLSAPGKALAATSLTVGSTTNYPTTTGTVIAIRVVDSAGELVAGTYTEWLATVTSGTTLAIDASPVYGSDQVYPAGSTTQVYIPISSYAQNRLVDGLLVEHTQSGTHGAVTATSLVSSGVVTGTTLTGTSVVSTGDIQHRSTSLETIRTETQFDYIASGGVWSGDAYASTRNASMTAVTCYIGGRRGTISAVTARSFTASKDTYVDVLNNSGTFSLVYTEVTNNAASPALAVSSIRLAIIVTGASNIASAGSVNQGEQDKVLPIASSIAYSVTDSLGNLICPRDPQKKLIGYQQTLSSFFAGTNVVTTVISVIINVPNGGRKVKLSGGGNLYMSGTVRDVVVTLREGSTKLSQGKQYPPAANNPVWVASEVTLTPTPGLHTYNLAISCGAGANVSVEAGVDEACFIKAELV